jgi:hypothetical protein
VQQSCRSEAECAWSSSIGWICVEVYPVPWIASSEVLRVVLSRTNTNNKNPPKIKQLNT